MVHRVDDPDIDVLLNKELWVSASPICLPCPAKSHPRAKSKYVSCCSTASTHPCLQKRLNHPTGQLLIVIGTSLRD